MGMVGMVGWMFRDGLINEWMGWVRMVDFWLYMDGYG
jgi:hypothetical protein